MRLFVSFEQRWLCSKGLEYWTNLNNIPENFEQYPLHWMNWHLARVCVQTRAPCHWLRLSPLLGNYSWLIRVTALESYVTLSPNTARHRVNWRASGTVCKWLSSLPQQHEPWADLWSLLPCVIWLRVCSRSESSLAGSFSWQSSPVLTCWILTFNRRHIWILVLEEGPGTLTLNCSINDNYTVTSAVIKQGSI